MFYVYGTKEFGTGGDTFDGDRNQTTASEPKAADGSVHSWALAYGPHEVDDGGELSLTLDGVRYAALLAAGH